MEHKVYNIAISNYIRIVKVVQFISWRVFRDRLDKFQHNIKKQNLTRYTLENSNLDSNNVNAGKEFKETVLKLFILGLKCTFVICKENHRASKINCAVTKFS